jgi:branched-chain amino acid transport system ATP-binding protein
VRVEPAVHERAALLEIENLEVIYNRSITAIQGVSLRVAAGSITALVGTNGAGKSTTLAAIAGFMRADDVQVSQGRIVFAGTPIQKLRNFRISEMGIALVPEREKIFATMTVLENLSACRAGGGRGPVVSLDNIFELFPSLAERIHSVAGYLSGGERQMLAISMALLNQPKLMLIDEMSLGLAPIVVAQFYEAIRQLRRDWGIAFLLVEQNAQAALDLADYTYVMENGRIVFDGTSERLRNHADFQEFYLGMGVEGERSFQNVKQYRRKRRWFG